jgi:hypothetical protein
MIIKIQFISVLAILVFLAGRYSLHLVHKYSKPQILPFQQALGFHFLIRASVKRFQLIVRSVSRNGHSFASSAVSIIVTTNKFTSASVSHVNRTVSSTTSYTFTVLLKNSLTSGASMKIILPS